ncbi:hypothetical protein BC826DRAFT_709152 [Russula brevipes]|nr:hypothetical protein BC826DRAFT_709152 [Russula brevipes]
MGMNPIALFATLPVPSDDTYTITLMHIHAPRARHGDGVGLSPQTRPSPWLSDLGSFVFSNRKRASRRTLNDAFASMWSDHTGTAWKALRTAFADTARYPRCFSTDSMGQVRRIATQRKANSNRPIRETPPRANQALSSEPISVNITKHSEPTCRHSTHVPLR